jgi:DNA-binding MarR family transcriptional regulator
MRLAPLDNEGHLHACLLQPGCPEARVATAKAWIEARRWRDKLLDCDLFADPAWDLMLDLYEKHYEAKPVTVTSACLAAKVPSATAFRQLSRLCLKGWVERHDDGSDRRKVQVSLTKAAVEAMDAVMDAALRSERKLTSSKEGPALLNRI